MDDWTDPDVLAARLGVPAPRVLAAATSLQLLDDKPGLARPVPARVEGRWTVRFAFSTRAVAQIEAWLAETSDPAAQAA